MSTPPEQDGRTHYSGCWRERGHHECAVALAEDLALALRLLRFETRACWGMEGSARVAFGNTNYHAVQGRLDEATAALARYGATPPPAPEPA